MHCSATFACTALAALLAQTVHSHMTMAQPKPFTSDLNNSPLDASGSDFPCKQKSGEYTGGTLQTMAIGSPQPLSFQGSAVHGGGSCQVSISPDEKPTKNSVWKVIASFEGGCPASADGNLPADPSNSQGLNSFNFEIPQGFSNGKATLAWTWFNRIGNREMYMNCAPIEITGGSSDQLASNTVYTSLPDMFVANVGNGCATAESKDLAFPNPGSVLKSQSTAGTTPPVPAGCGSSYSGKGSAGTSAPATGGNTSDTSSGSASGAAASSAPVLAEQPSASAAPPSTLATSTTAAAPASTMVTVIVVTPVPASPAGGSTGSSGSSTGSSGSTTGSSGSSGSTTPPTTPGGSGSTGSTAPSTPSTPSTGGMTGACSTEGTFNCLPGGTSFQQCASGTWSVVQSVAQGTKCAPGQGTLSIGFAKRSTIILPVSSVEDAATLQKRHLRVHRRTVHPSSGKANKQGKAGKGDDGKRIGVETHHGHSAHGMVKRAEIKA